MTDRPTDAPINELLGSASVFVSALNGVMEQKLLSEMAGSRLSLSQLKIFKLLDVSGPRNIGHVAAFLGVSNAAASKTVDRLVRGRYLRRVEARADRRESEISLADPGRKLLNRYETARNRTLAQIFGTLERDGVRRTARLLERLTRAIVAHSGNVEGICLQCGIYLQNGCVVRDAARADCCYQIRTKKPPGRPRLRAPRP
jgi:DNA-binding MarR family transcriptional regulator